MAYNRLENPPLWIWAVIVGGIIAGKFIYRWQLTKQLAKEDQERTTKIHPNDKTKDLKKNDHYDSNTTGYAANMWSHKYNPRRYYKDYFATKKKR
jgi:hypothetical protein